MLLYFHIVIGFAGIICRVFIIFASFFRTIPASILTMKNLQCLELLTKRKIIILMTCLHRRQWLAAITAPYWKRTMILCNSEKLFWDLFYLAIGLLLNFQGTMSQRYSHWYSHYSTEHKEGLFPASKLCCLDRKSIVSKLIVAINTYVLYSVYIFLSQVIITNDVAKYYKEFCICPKIILRKKSQILSDVNKWGF